MEEFSLKDLQGGVAETVPVMLDNFLKLFLTELQGFERGVHGGQRLAQATWIFILHVCNKKFVQFSDRLCLSFCE